MGSSLRGWRSFAMGSMVALAACMLGEAPLPDASVNGDSDGGHADAGSRSDASNGLDASEGRDASSSADASSGRDASSGADASSGRDASSGSDASNVTGTAPCDIYQSASTPCVAAHSTVRALYSAYDGSLYQVRRSDGATKDIPVQSAGGFVDISVQDSFCSNSTCTISILYDQSPNKNDLKKSPEATWLPKGGNESSATQGKISVSGHTAYGIYVSSDSVAYRNNSTKGIATGDQAEAMYMIVDGKRSSGICCFDYGNAEANGLDNGNGTMEALYWGTDTSWGGKGDGNGPWLAADLENGMFKSDKGGSSASSPNDKSIIANFVTGMLKGPSGNSYALKGGDAQSGKLTTLWDGNRPSPDYSPKRLEGAIILGTGGDGSNFGVGTFYEGAMTMGNPPDATDDAIQANIVAAEYGK